MKTMHFMILSALFFAVGVMAQRPDTRWYTDNPEAEVFEISTADELAGLAELVNREEGAVDFRGKTIRLVNDIDLSEHYGEGYNEGRGWIPIGGVVGRSEGGGEIGRNFNGVFDGDGRKIKGVYIPLARLGRGLFGWVGGEAEIRGVGLVDMNVTEIGDGLSDHVGGIAGRNEGKISDCYVIGELIRGADDVGGIVGVNVGIVENCYSAIGVMGSWRVGGIAGHNLGSVRDCYTIGLIRGGDEIGGIVGIATDGSVENCYATGEVRGHDGYVGGIVGVARTGVVVRNNAALNPKVWTTYIPGGMMPINKGWSGRVWGKEDFDPAGSNNIAFSNMKNKNDVAVWDGIGAAKKDGEDITAVKINADGTLGGLFSNEEIWTIKDGSLPGLFGNAVEMPEHLKVNIAVADKDNTIPEDESYEDVAVVTPLAPRTVGQLTVGPNPVSGNTSVINFYHKGNAIKRGTLMVYDANGNLVKRLAIRGETAAVDNGDEIRLIASWDLTNNRSRRVKNGTYLARATLITSDGKREDVSLVVGIGR